MYTIYERKFEKKYASSIFILLKIYYDNIKDYKPPYLNHLMYSNNDFVEDKIY